MIASKLGGGSVLWLDTGDYWDLETIAITSTLQGYMYLDCAQHEIG